MGDELRERNIHTVARARAARHYGCHRVTRRSAVEKSRPATTPRIVPFWGERSDRIGQPGRIFGFVRYFEVSRANRLLDASVVLVARNGPVPSGMSGPAHCDQ